MRERKTEREKERERENKRERVRERIANEVQGHAFFVTKNNECRKRV